MKARPVKLLLVEDNPADVDLALDALAQSSLTLEISVANDGVDAMECLQGRGRHRAALRPDLILLDLNLPRKSGREFLKELRLDPDWKRIPVVILSSSDADRDVLQSYELGANCYIIKPVELARFQSVVAGIEGFWFTIVKLPPRIEG